MKHYTIVKLVFVVIYRIFTVKRTNVLKILYKSKRVCYNHNYFGGAVSA